MEAPKDAQPGAGPKRAGSGPKTLQDGSILAPLREVVVRAGGLEPPRPVKVCGFSYHFGFRRPVRQVRGLDYPFTIPPDGG